MERLANLPNIWSDSNLTEIKKFYDKIESHVRYLDSLNVKSDSYSALLVSMIMGMLPPQLKLVVSCNVRLELWGLAELLNLINKEIKAGANCGEYNFGQGNEFDHLDRCTTSGLASQASKNISSKCIFCLVHWSDKCDVMTGTEAGKIYLKNHKRCFNCLSEGHLSNRCLKKPKGATTAKEFITLLFVISEKKGKQQKQIKLKALLDSGSEKSFLSQRVYTCLQLPTICTKNLKINTFGNENSQNSLAKKVRFQLKTVENKFMETNAYVTPLICLPIKNQPLNSTKKYFGKYSVNFSDRGHIGYKTDLLIGMDYYQTSMTGKIQELNELGNLVMLESVFGWILSGSLKADSTENHVINTNVTCVLRAFATDGYNYKNDVYKFSDLETLGISEKE